MKKKHGHVVVQLELAERGRQSVLKVRLVSALREVRSR
jgi:hypothetical protein